MLNPFAAIARMFSGTVQTLNSGASITLDVRGQFLTVITAAGTANVSCVNDASASADASETAANEAVAAATKQTFSGVEWGFRRLTATGGALRYYCYNV